MTKIAVVDKAPSKTSYDIFDFEYDLFHLTDERTGKKKSLVKADVQLDPKELDPYDFVILVGADPAKHIAKITQVTKYAGHLVNDKYIPIINPIMAKFKPEVEPILDAALTKINMYIKGDVEVDTGTYYGITRAEQALNYLDILLRADDIENIAMDTETTGLYPRDGYVLGIGISEGHGTGTYIRKRNIAF